MPNGRPPCRRDAIARHRSGRCRAPRPCRPGAGGRRPAQMNRGPSRDAIACPAVRPTRSSPCRGDPGSRLAMARPTVTGAPVEVTRQRVGGIAAGAVGLPRALDVVHAHGPAPDHATDPSGCFAPVGRPRRRPPDWRWHTDRSGGPGAVPETPPGGTPPGRRVPCIGMPSARRTTLCAPSAPTANSACSSSVLEGSFADRTTAQTRSPRWFRSTTSQPNRTSAFGSERKNSSSSGSSGPAAPTSVESG